MLKPILDPLTLRPQISAATLVDATSRTRLLDSETAPIGWRAQSKAVPGTFSARAVTAMGLNGPMKLAARRRSLR